MISLLFILSNAFIFSNVNSYILGESDSDPNFMRCWQNGLLMLKCPEGLSWSWNFSQEELWYESETYTIEINMTWSTEFSNNVVYQTSDTLNLIPHINVHSCKFDLGKVCVPFIGANGDSVSHTSVITAENNDISNGLYYSTVSLTEGQWNVIAHGRLYLNDTKHYPLEGETLSCDNSTSNTITLPWKLDFAIGMPHEVLPPIKTNTSSTTSIEGWQIFVVIVVIVGIIGLVWRLYKKYSKKEGDIDDKQSAESQLKKNLIFELTSLAITLALATFDWLTDTIALIDLQSYDDLNPMLVIGYFGMVIIITLFYFYTSYSGITDIIAVVNEYKYGIKEVTFVTSKSEREASGKEDDSISGGTINYEFTRIRRGITTEKISIAMCLVEDCPMFVFNAILLFALNIDSSALLISFVTNAVILGYKFSGIERLWYLLQLKNKVDTMISAVKISRQVTNNALEINSNTKKQIETIQSVLINNDSTPQHQIFM